MLVYLLVVWFISKLICTRYYLVTSNPSVFQTLKRHICPQSCSGDKSNRPNRLFYACFPSFVRHSAAGMRSEKNFPSAEINCSNEKATGCLLPPQYFISGVRERATPSLRNLTFN